MLLYFKRNNNKKTVDIDNIFIWKNIIQNYSEKSEYFTLFQVTIMVVWSKQLDTLLFLMQYATSWKIQCMSIEAWGRKSHINIIIKVILTLWSPKWNWEFQEACESYFKNCRPGEMAQWVKYLLCRLGDLSVNFQHPCTSWGIANIFSLYSVFSQRPLYPTTEITVRSWFGEQNCLKG